MGIKILPGTSTEAQKELSAYIMAYPVNWIGHEEDVQLYWTPDDTDAECFDSMELNDFLGTFDPVAYLLNLEHID